jgi:hypothetical protein
MVKPRKPGLEDAPVLGEIRKQPTVQRAVYLYILAASHGQQQECNYKAVQKARDPLASIQGTRTTAAPRKVVAPRPPPVLKGAPLRGWFAS